MITKNNGHSEKVENGIVETKCLIIKPVLCLTRLSSYFEAFELKEN